MRQQGRQPRPVVEHDRRLVRHQRAELPQREGPQGFRPEIQLPESRLEACERWPDLAGCAQRLGHLQVNIRWQPPHPVGVRQVSHETTQQRLLGDRRPVFEPSAVQLYELNEGRQVGRIELKQSGQPLLD